MSADGYQVEEVTGQGAQVLACYGLNEPAAVDACRWYNRLLRGRRVFRVVLRIGASVSVVA